jgi:hypothetical protein
MVPFRKHSFLSVNQHIQLFRRTPVDDQQAVTASVHNRHLMGLAIVEECQRRVESERIHYTQSVDAVMDVHSMTSQPFRVKDETVDVPSMSSQPFRVNLGLNHIAVITSACISAPKGVAVGACPSDLALSVHGVWNDFQR